MTDFAPKNTSGNFRFTERDYNDAKIHKRNLILWEVPHIGNNRYIEMYINPQGINASNRKTINTKRTKGGFISQYWGEEYETLNISGSSGDGGIEAINALEDVYRSEQLAFEEIVRLATVQAADDDSELTNDLIKRRQPLGALAATVIMWYMGQGKRGFFVDFQVDEVAQTPGVFAYRMNFTVVETINRRRNFMPWHRKPWSTTETPNVSANGRVVVTGGYSGDTSTRLGRLSSPAGDVITKRVEEDGTSAFRSVWNANPLFDPKYWSEDFPTQPLHALQALDPNAEFDLELDPSKAEETKTPVDKKAGEVSKEEPKAGDDEEFEKEAKEELKEQEAEIEIEPEPEPEEELPYQCDHPEWRRAQAELERLKAEYETLRRRAVELELKQLPRSERRVGRRERREREELRSSWRQEAARIRRSDMAAVNDQAQEIRDELQLIQQRHCQ